MVKKGNKQQNIVLTEDDQVILDYLKQKLNLKPTEIYRLALRSYYRLERKLD